MAIRNLNDLIVIGASSLGDLHTNFSGASFNCNIGFENYNNGFAALATGQNTLADGNLSTSMGYQCKATGVASLAGGNTDAATPTTFTEAKGEASLAFGQTCIANANYSQAFGRATATGGGLTSANQAMAMGYQSTAWNDNSFSGGENSNSFGRASLAFGQGATASNGIANISLGLGTTTSVTAGFGANGSGQTAVGKYNVYALSIGHAFAVGTGTSDTSRSTALCVTYANRIGINNTNPSNTLDVTGTGRFTSTVTATNFILSSDERKKKDIKDLEPLAINANWKSFKLKTFPNQYRTGVVAQELEKQHPEFVRTDSDGYKSVAYVDLLIAKVAELEARLAKLEK